MSVFADSSALVKLYSDEPGHELVRAVELFLISHLARVEVPAALWRKQRIGELSSVQAQLLNQEFEADYFGTSAEAPRLLAMRTTAEMLDCAARLCAAHGLRAYDAVQLATALVVRGTEPTCRTFAAFDGVLRQAAATEGFELLPAS